MQACAAGIFGIIISAAQRQTFAMKTFLLFAALFFACDPAAMSHEKCFIYQGGGFDDEIRVTIDGSSVKGQLSVGRTNSEMPTRMYPFTGTFSNGVIVIKFDGDKVPTAFERTGDKMTGTLSGENLTVKLSDGTQEVYSAVFRPCK
jgi:hypothetical protein